MIFSFEGCSCTATSTELTMRYNLSTREMAGSAFQSVIRCVKLTTVLVIHLYSTHNLPKFIYSLFSIWSLHIFCLFVLCTSFFFQITGTFAYFVCLYLKQYCTIRHNNIPTALFPQSIGGHRSQQVHLIR